MREEREYKITESGGFHLRKHKREGVFLDFSLLQQKNFLKRERERENKTLKTKLFY